MSHELSRYDEGRAICTCGRALHDCHHQGGSTMDEAPGSVVIRMDQDLYDHLDRHRAPGETFDAVLRRALAMPARQHRRSQRAAR